jgi:hypothetical protein
MVRPDLADTLAGINLPEFTTTLIAKNPELKMAIQQSRSIFSYPRTLP